MMEPHFGAASHESQRNLNINSNPSVARLNIVQRQNPTLDHLLSNIINGILHENNVSINDALNVISNSG